MEQRIVRTALIQQAIPSSRKEGMVLLSSEIREAASRGARLVVLQELHNTPYFCQTEDTRLFDLAEPIPGLSTDFYGALAAELHIVLVTSLFERRAPGLYHNTAVVFEADGSIATSVGTLGVLVCWDQWYPEAARLMALRGAEILIYPTAIGWESSDPEEEQKRQLGAWMTVQRGHAVANGLPLLAVNRVGHEPDPSEQTGGIQFWGHSFAAGPQGELLAEAGEEPALLMVDVDLSRSEAVRRWWPFLRDRRIDAYRGIEERYLDD